MAEYYFDYKFKVVKDELGIRANLPKLYFEKQYLKKGVTHVDYIMYVTFDQWNPTDKGKTDSPKVFDVADVYYDTCGIGLDSLDAIKGVIDEKKAKENHVEVVKTVTYDEYAKSGFRYIILDASNAYSGVGRIIFKNSKGKESELVFGVNFRFKKVITWKLMNDKIHFFAEGVSQKIFLVLNEADEYPCLKRNVEESAFTDRFEVDFQGKKKVSKNLNMSKHKDKKLYVSFDPHYPEQQNNYLLECIENATIDTGSKDYVRQDSFLFCPFCHEKINVNADLKKHCRHGGVSCEGTRFAEGNGTPILLSEGKARKRVSKNVLYCSNDFEKGKNGIKLPYEETSLMRVLPDHFLKRKHFKVIIVGSKRSGKTTFISRLFDIAGKGGDTEFHMVPMQNGTKRLCDIEPYSLKTLESDSGSSKILTSAYSWYKKSYNFYDKYSIDISTGTFVEPTDTAASAGNNDKKRDITKFPFVVDVNSESYIYFYDMAGEDAQRSTEFVGNLVGDAPVAIFYLIDSNADPDDISNVARRIKEVMKTRSQPCPVAVIVTKFDAQEAKFDENCHCLRADVQEMINTKHYEGSYLERNVNFASEEIRSFLAQKGIRADFGEMVNVKYFGVSSFSGKDSIYHRDQTSTSDEVNYLLHESSPKRMELPVIWILRQFGCII